MLTVEVPVVPAVKLTGVVAEISKSGGGVVDVTVRAIVTWRSSVPLVPFTSTV